MPKSANRNSCRDKHIGGSFSPADQYTSTRPLRWLGAVITGDGF